MKTYLVDVKYTVAGVLTVRAESEEEARRVVLEEMTFPGTCDMIDHEIERVREDVHGISLRHHEAKAESKRRGRE